MKNGSNKDSRPDRTSFGQPKIDRYKWAHADRPGQFQLISKHQLSVDHEYQRDPTGQAKILRFARDFSWPHFGALIVARRASDNSLWVVDGQHRLLAALKRTDVDLVPCMIFESSGIVNEAATFLGINGTRASVSAVSKFRALIAMGDPVALHVQSLLAKAGRVASSSNGATTVSCVSLMCKLQRSQPEILARLWPVVSSVCRGTHVHDRLLDTLMYIERRIAPTSLCEPKWQDRLHRAGPVAILQEISAASALYKRGGVRVWAMGVVGLLNKGMRSGGRLQMAITDDSIDGPDDTGTLDPMAGIIS